MVSTLCRIPPSPAEIAERLAVKMSLVRQTLMSKGEYLSDPAIRGRVQWVSCGPGHKLVIKSEDPQASDAADPPSSSTDDTTSTPTSGIANAQLPTPDATPVPPPAPPIPVTLAMVVQIIPGQSWLHPDGKWMGPMQFVKQFSDVKLLCTGTMPDHVRFHNDYATSATTLKAIMAEIRTMGYPTTSVLSGPDQNIQVCHNLFTVS